MKQIFMKQILKTMIIPGLFTGLVATAAMAQSPGRDNDRAITLSSGQMALANIRVARLEARIMTRQIYAPGEIRANGYTSYQVSPRVDSVALRRHVALGDHVKKGQALITLFRETVADAEADYSVARAEWRRVQKLGRNVVSERRYISAQSKFRANYGRLLAFGISEKAIRSLSGKVEILGKYTLVAKTPGVVLNDDFNQGQRVQAGDALMEIVDEQQLWVEARLAPTMQLNLPSGTEVRVKVGADSFMARVAQQSHVIDRQTRTRVVRLVVENRDHRLHPGMFAEVYFRFPTKKPVLAVPETALVRGVDGDWLVFVEDQPGSFRPQEVKPGRRFGNQREIRGVAAGTIIVTAGAFFVASEIAKSGFGSDNH
ncbi:MAG: efflux RND transporter periplasmic adaptor subunit [Alphaproteobacteria bacterium]|nr:efflux RND transporter periplasmic adaptor subunit [Alphaproteobacteria bacterium]